MCITQRLVQGQGGGVEGGVRSNCNDSSKLNLVIEWKGKEKVKRFRIKEERQLGRQEECEIALMIMLLVAMA